MTIKNHCSTDRIERLFAQELDEHEMHVVESHLESCEACRKELEQFAAKPEFWSTIRETLSGRSISEAQKIQSSNQSIAESIRVFADTYLSPSDDPAMMGRIANYEVCGVVGLGAMGIVFKAFDKPLNRFVAIKVLLPSFALQGCSRERFSREARAAAAVVHPNVIAIHAIESWNGLPYLVMPYVAGQSLQKRVDDAGPLDLPEILRVGHQVASGLSAAHAQGLIHRDIKPSNVLLESDVDRFLITDFGLAQAADDASLTQSGVIAGTPMYMSPEQARGDTVDHRSDLFSLGSLLFTLSTGHPPFRAETTFGVLRRVINEDPRSIQEANPDVPGWLCEIIRALHSKQPEDRIESAAKAAVLFEQCIAHVRQPHRHPLPKIRSRLPTDRQIATKARSVALVSAMGVVLVGISVIALPRFFGSQTPTFLTRNKRAIVDPQAHRYDFQSHPKVTYLLAMSVAMPNSDVQVDGLVTVDSKQTDEGHWRLLFSPQLNVSETTRKWKESEEGPIPTGKGTQSKHWKSSRSEGVIINSRGKILSEDSLTLLPYHAGTFPALLFRPLPLEADSPTIARSASGITIQDSEQTSGDETDIDYWESKFIFGRGIPESVRMAKTLNIEVDGVNHVVPMQIEFVRLNEEERDVWIASRAGSRPAARRRKAIPLTADEESRLLSDLKAEQRVLYWLHRVRSRSIDELSPEVINAIVELVDNANPTCRVLAKRILNELPEEKLNPFRFVD